jgi:pimeloyl-ACP methyl ester carboxylesterase
MTMASWLRSSRLSRFFRTALALSALAASPACGTSSDAGPEPSTEPPAQEVPARVVELVEHGAGDTTVVFESGLGNDWSPWKKILEEVGVRARAVAYSRPGYGESEPSPDPRDAAHIAEDLRTLLLARGYAPPYLLVGHSFGGAYMELFAKAHPAEVVGVVLVDPRHRDFTAACEETGFDGCLPPDSVVATLPQVQQDEIAGFAHTSEQIAAVGSFGAYPVRVLTATSHGFPPDLESVWQSQHAALAAEAVNGEQIVFPGATHLLQLAKPHEVAEVILSLVPAPGGV